MGEVVACSMAKCPDWSQVDNWWRAGVRPSKERKGGRKTWKSSVRSPFWLVDSLASPDVGLTRIRSRREVWQTLFVPKIRRIPSMSAQCEMGSEQETWLNRCDARLPTQSVGRNRLLCQQCLALLTLVMVIQCCKGQP